MNTINELITDTERIINLEKELNSFLKSENIKGKVKLIYYRRQSFKSAKAKINFSFELKDIKSIAMFFFMRNLSFKLMSFPTHLKEVNCLIIVTEKDVKGDL